MYGYLELLTLALIPGFIALDLVYRSRRQTATRFWRLRATAVTVLAVLFTIEVAGFWGRVFGGSGIWLLVDVGVLRAGSMNAIAWLALFALGTLLAVGLSWSHVWRRLSGQLEVDDD
jgi:hypothetical protein